MILDDYEKDLFYSLENSIGDFEWYSVEHDRKDKERFVETIKKRIDYYDDYEFNTDYTEFRRKEPFKKENYHMHGQITYFIEWKEDKGELTDKERNLPDPKYTEPNKIVKRRAQ